MNATFTQSYLICNLPYLHYYCLVYLNLHTHMSTCEFIFRELAYQQSVSTQHSTPCLLWYTYILRIFRQSLGDLDLDIGIALQLCVVVQCTMYNVHYKLLQKSWYHNHSLFFPSLVLIHLPCWFGDTRYVYIRDIIYTV